MAECLASVRRNCLPPVSRSQAPHRQSDCSAQAQRYIDMSTLASADQATRQTHSISTRPGWMEQGAPLGLRTVDLEGVDLSPPSHSIPVVESAVRALLKLYPVGSHARHGHLVQVAPTGPGFPIVVSKSEGGRFILEFGGWHEDELRLSDVVALVEKALAGRIRLIEECVGGKHSSHSIEILSNEKRWHLIGSISYVRWFRSWRSRTTSVHQFPISKVHASVFVV